MGKLSINQEYSLLIIRKVVKTEDEAWNAQEQYNGLPHGWIQWKGTNVCMDIHCTCGYHSHIDDDFTYYIRCPRCDRKYMCNGHIELIEITEPFNPGCGFKQEEGLDETIFEQQREWLAEQGFVFDDLPYNDGLRTQFNLRFL